MPRKNSNLTFTDQFCGAGGSSQGVRRLSQRYTGVEVKLALNHWQLAIDTHNTNFPDTLHDCTDISACDPRRYPSTDVLITSPECTTHSPSGGNTHKALKLQMDLFSKGKINPATERSRATMWDVCRFAEYHKYNAIIVENVVEAKTKWELFDIWLMAMHKLGYDHKCVFLNSMHCHPTPQSRDRMYVVFWKKGNKAPDLDYNPLAHCPKCSKDVNAVQTWKNPLKKFGKYDKQYVYCCASCTSIVKPYYYAAYNIIDWSDIGTKMSDREKELSPVTKKRVVYGLDKYENEPFFLHAAYSDNARGVVRPMVMPLFTQTTIKSQAVVLPFIIKGEQSSCEGMVKSVQEPLQTQQKRQTFGIVTHESFKSFLASYNTSSHCLQYFTEATGTITTKDRLSLVTYSKPQYEDCYYRMLKPGEVKLGMGFDPHYKILGNGKDQVIQCGNAVTPPAMEMLCERVIQSFN